MEILNKIDSKLSKEGKYLLRDVEQRISLYNIFIVKHMVITSYNISRHLQRCHTRFNPIFLTQKTFQQHFKYYKKHSADIDTF
jgi:hypothetical protein